MCCSCEKWIYCPIRGKFAFLSAWEPSMHPHPDGKHRDLVRHGARILKRSGVVSCPVQRTDKRRELRDMRNRLQMERKEFAMRVAARLAGREWWNHGI
jgi:hypothetical protein